jgi:enoyl-CoA hydratase
MLTQDHYKAMLIEKRANGVAVVTLNRPDRLNAVNATLHHELSTFTRDAQADDEVKVVVLAGAGRAFCAGGDFSPDANTTSEITLEEGRQIVDHLLELRKPIVAAVQGYAMGLGATIALLCDVVVAGKSTVVADTHVRMGIGAGDGGAVIWPLLMGVNRAKWFLMTGDRVTGADLYELGLVSFLVEDGEILTKALECADRLAAGPAAAISASKVPINQYIRMVSNLVLPLSLSLEGESMRSHDAKEAQTAFAEKRPPRFTGR